MFHFRPVSLKLNHSYTPKELGFDMPEVPAIHYGFCCYKGWTPQDTILGISNNFLSWAHAHGIKSGKEPYQNQICIVIPVQNFVYNQGKREPSDIMLHEYGHALDELKSEHDKPWQDIMTNYLKRPDLAKPTQEPEAMGVDPRFILEAMISVINESLNFNIYFPTSKRSFNVAGDKISESLNSL